RCWYCTCAISSGRLPDGVGGPDCDRFPVERRSTAVGGDMNIRPGGVLLGIALSACAAPPSLVPGPGAVLVPGDPDAAVARDAGVQVTAWADRWNGDPRTLE